MSSSLHDTAQRLSSEIQGSDLHVLDAKAKFLARRTNDDEDWSVNDQAPDGKVPAELAAEVKFQLVSEWPEYLSLDVLTSRLIETFTESEVPVSGAICKEKVSGHYHE